MYKIPIYWEFACVCVCGWISRLSRALIWKPAPGSVILRRPSWGRWMVSQAGRCIDDRGAGTGTLAARPLSCLCLRAADVRPVIRAEDPSWGSELRMREPARPCWLPRCLLLVVGAHAASVSAGRDLRPCDEVSGLYLHFKTQSGGMRQTLWFFKTIFTRINNCICLTPSEALMKATAGPQKHRSCLHPKGFSWSTLIKIKNKNKCIWALQCLELCNNMLSWLIGL